MPLLTNDLIPQCTMKRVIVHWTAGAYRASDLDREHYHLLIEGSGQIVRGKNSISANQAPPHEPRASHTKNCNTGSIGVAVCCMAGAIERPFSAGLFPLTEGQWEMLAEVVAELCGAYDIEVTPDTVLAHGEVQDRLNIPQRGKWDPMVLPFAPTRSRADVMSGFRERVREHLDAR